MVRNLAGIQDGEVVKGTSGVKYADWPETSESKQTSNSRWVLISNLSTSGNTSVKHDTSIEYLGEISIILNTC